MYLTSSVHLVATCIAKDFNLTKDNKLVFITTATEDKKRSSPNWIDEDRNALMKAGFDVFDYTITGKTEKQIREDLINVNFIYIEGGNTFLLLERAQQTNFISIIRDLVLKEEKIYIGTSAGSVIASPDIYPIYILDKAEVASNLKGYKGFNLVDFIIFPHWGSDKFRELYLNKGLDHMYSGDNEIILLRDNQYIEVKDEWYRIVSV
jgi:dipeptidase E